MFDLYTSEMLLSNNFCSNLIICSGNPNFIDVKELKANKVMQFTFEHPFDSTNKIIIKTICNENDTFSLEESFYIALAKFLSHKTLTPEGISLFAKELHYYKEANKIVKRGMRLYEHKIQEQKKKELEEKEKKAIRARKIEKKKRYKERKMLKYLGVMYDDNF